MKKDIFKGINIKKNKRKDWRDAFVEANIIKEEQKKDYSNAETIKIVKAMFCDTYQCLMSYVSQFESGGFWFNEKTGLYFTTKGTKSDEEATYEDAKDFIETYQKSK